MKQLIIIIALILTSGFFTNLKAQYCGAATTNVTIIPTSTSQLTATYSSGRRAFNFVVTAGCVYEFSTCGQTIGDSYLRLYSTGTGGTLLAQNDNFCGTQSTLTWTATINGTVSILLTRTSCNTLGTSTKMSYRRISCSPPSCATLIAPIDMGTNISIGQTLSWNSVVGATSYDVYFGTNSSPPLIGNQSGTTYNPGTLTYNATYYWKIVPKNSNGLATGCSIWSFTTTGPGCLNAQYGQYPASTYNPLCTGTVENINTACYASEYTVVNLLNGINYTLSSSIVTDYITISDVTGTTVLAYGVGSVVFQPTANGNYRFYTHTNNLCGSSTTSRTRRIQCSAPPPPSNDICNGAIDVGQCGGTFNGTTQYATNGDGSDCGSSPSETWVAPGVWYKVVGNGQNITASLCSSSYDTKIYIYTGNCGALTCLTNNDDFCSLQSQSTFPSTLGTTYYILVTGYGSARGSFVLNVSLNASPPIITTQPISDTICSTGSTVLSVTNSGVQGPFTYTWFYNGISISNSNNTSLSTSIGGDYYVKVTNACGVFINSNIASVNISPTMSITSVVDGVGCFGSSTGAVYLTVTGGIAPFTYLWSNGMTSDNLTNIPEGTYTVVITDVIGCQKSHVVTVTQNTEIVITLNKIDVNCYGGNDASISASVSGGTPLYTYNWSNGGTTSTISQLSPGTYTLTITDEEQCIETASVTISQPSLFLISVDSQTISSCQTTPVQLTVTPSGGTDLSQSTYLWSNGVTTNSISVLPTTTTVYTVEAWDNKGCYSTAQSTITVIQSSGNLPYIGSIFGTDQAYTYMINGGTTTYSILPVLGASSYIWYIPNNGVQVVGTNTTNILTVQFTQYFTGGQFYVKAFNNCQTSTSDTLQVDILQNPMIDGPECVLPLGSIKTYIIANPVSGLIYNWIKPYGTSILSGQGNDTLKIKYSTSFQSPNDLGVSVTTIFGTFMSETQVMKGPTSPTVILGPTSICADNSTIYEYYVDSVPTATYYIWGLPNSTIVVSGQGNDTIRVKFNTTYISGNFNVQAVNNCGSSAMRYGYVTNSNQQFYPGSIAGPGDLCPYLGSTTTYSVPFQNGYTYTWVAPTGMSIMSGQGTNIINIQVSNTFTYGTMSVKLNEGCGDSPYSTRILSTQQTSISVSQIQGLTNPCYIVGLNQTTTYNISPINGVNYNWSVPSNATIVSGQGSNSISVSFQTGFSGGVISVLVSGGCASPTTVSKTITLGFPSMTITGNRCVENNTSYNYSVSFPSMAYYYNVQGYTWVPPANAIVTSGQGTQNVTIAYTSNFESNCTNNLCDSIKVYVQFPCGVKLVKVRIGMTTYPVTSIQGPSSTCGPDTIILNVSLPTPIRATGYIWVYPGATSFVNILGTLNANTNDTIFAKINSTFVSGTFNVQSFNQCGSTAMRYFYVSKNCPTAYTVNTYGGTEIITKMEDIMNNPEYMESLNKKIDFIVYPNPGKDVIELRIFKGNEEYYLVQVKNSLNQIVYQKLKEKEDNLILKELNSGIYFITVSDKNGNTITKQLVIL